MTIDLVFPVLPPALDGIGDYTARLAEELGKTQDARVLTAQSDPEALAGVDVLQVFSNRYRTGILEIVNSVRERSPDWCILQYNQFSYGRWGFNPFVPIAIYQIGRQLPCTRIAVMFHEDFVPVTSWKNAIMTTWQRAQFYALGRLADAVFFSIDPWAKRYASWFPSASVRHLPVGSNIPHVDISQERAREEIGLHRNTFVPGIFGTLHASRMLPLIRKSILALSQHVEDLKVLYVGPDGERLREVLRDVVVIDAGRQPAEGVARHLAAMDVHLTPFIDGVSTRRGSFLAGLQQGVASISTDGPLTDTMLREQNGHAFVLSPLNDENAFVRSVIQLYEDVQLRARVKRQAGAFFEKHFTWPSIATQLVDTLLESTSHPSQISS